MQNKDWVMLIAVAVIAFLCGLLAGQQDIPTPTIDCMEGMTGVYFFESTIPTRWVLDTIKPASCVLYFE